LHELLAKHTVGFNLGRNQFGELRGSRELRQKQISAVYLVAVVVAL
jgi:hypothetical protein